MEQEKRVSAARTAMRKRDWGEVGGRGRGEVNGSGIERLHTNILGRHVVFGIWYFVFGIIVILLIYFCSAKEFSADSVIVVLASSQEGGRRIRAGLDRICTGGAQHRYLSYSTTYLYLSGTLPCLPTLPMYRIYYLGTLPSILTLPTSPVLWYSQMVHHTFR